MYSYIFDGSFQGFLSVIFAVYEQKQPPEHIIESDKQQVSLFSEGKAVKTNYEKAGRVRNKLKALGIYQQVYHAFLTEQPEVCMLLYHYIHHIILHGKSESKNYTLSKVLKVKQLNKFISREVHRMHAFIRFQKLLNGDYIATIQPDFNVLPLLPSHFKDRFADMNWTIFDTKRQYGISFQHLTSEVSEVRLAEGKNLKSIPDTVLHQEQQNFEKLWQEYFQSTTITERKNTKLHLQHVPRRYWKHLPEKHHSI